MDNDGKFWISFCAIVAITIIFVTYFSLSYWKDYNAKIAEMIKNGTSPMAAICALQDDYGKMPVCLVLATKEK